MNSFTAYPQFYLCYTGDRTDCGNAANCHEATETIHDCGDGRGCNQFDMQRFIHHPV